MIMDVRCGSSPHRGQARPTVNDDVRKICV